jgi:TolA-binding protein
MASPSSRTRGILHGLALLGLALTAVAGPAAHAQTPGFISSPQEVAACLCLERSVSSLANEAQARNRIYEEKRQALEQLERQVAEMRQRMNVNDTAQVDAFRNLLDRRNAAQAEFANQLTPEYAALVERYNRRVSEFNTQCGNRTYDPSVLASVRATLSCPAQ